MNVHFLGKKENQKKLGRGGITKAWVREKLGQVIVVSNKKFAGGGN